MPIVKRPTGVDVLTAARDRIRYVFEHFEAIYISFSAGKDSSVMFHLVMDEAIKRGRRVGVLLIDLEAQYNLTIQHALDMFEHYAEHIDLHWVCLPIKLRNSVSNYEPVWCAWDPDREADWVRPMPTGQGVISDPAHFDFFQERMEFEEFITLFAAWYSRGRTTAAFIGIRTDESLNRWRTIALWDKETHMGKRWTTKVVGDVFNAYPIYDWHVTDIWRYHSAYPDRLHNEVYDRMHLAGVSLHQMRLCQPYGDDQKRGLWLYHLIEPQTWGRVVARVNGANSGSLYIEERGNVTGYNKITLPPGHTWKSFCLLLLATMPEVTRNHYIPRFQAWLYGWHERGYRGGYPTSRRRSWKRSTGHPAGAGSARCSCAMTGGARAWGWCSPRARHTPGTWRSRRRGSRWCSE